MGSVMEEILHKDGKFYIGEEPERAELDYYIEDGDVMRITHTFVPQSFRGRGIAKKLVLKAIEFARSEGHDIKPTCSYVKTFFEKNHSAGNFIRKYKKDWKYFEKNELKNLSNHFLNKKNIEVIGATKNVSQLKYAGEILKKFSNHQNTALVLGDETLLSVALNSIPENVNAINITMGYPLQNVPTSQLISSIFHLFITQDKLQKIVSNEFYHKDMEMNTSFFLREAPWLSDHLVGNFQCHYLKLQLL